MDLEYGVRKWPQPGNNRPNLEFISLYSNSRISKPKPLNPEYYERYAKFKLAKEVLEKELEVAAAKVAKADADLTLADEALAQNKWSKAAAKISNVQRLKNLLAEVKAAESLISTKLNNLNKEYSGVAEMVRLQASMEETYEESVNRKPYTH